MDIEVIRNNDGSVDGAVLRMMERHAIITCAVMGCSNEPSTVLLISGHPDLKRMHTFCGCCEAHYLAAEQKGEWDYTLDIS